MIVIKDDKTRAVRDAAIALAREPFPVLILGEPGSGRAAMAGVLHEHGPPGDSSFSEVECSNVTSLEAVTITGTGTLVLRHLDRLRPALQESLSAAVERLPDGRRVVATGPPDLPDSARLGTFNSALLSAFSHAVLRVPSLRERPADIPSLVALFADDVREGGRRIAVSEAAMGYLLNYDWPGNVRELELLIRCVRQRKGGGVVSIDDLPPQIRWFPGNRCDRRSRAKSESGFNPLSEEFQFQLIADALRRTHVR